MATSREMGPPLVSQSLLVITLNVLSSGRNTLQQGKYILEEFQ